MISKTQITRRTIRKKNPEIVETILFAKKNNLLDLAKKLSAPLSQYAQINLDRLDRLEDEKIMVIGKVLGSGEIGRKFEVSALGFSEIAREKLKKAGCKAKTIKDEIKTNSKLDGVKIL